MVILIRDIYPLSFSSKIRVSIKKIPKTLKCILWHTRKNMNMYRSYHYHEDVDILKMFDKIIPQLYFGCTHNRKIFYRIVQKIISQTRNEYVYISTLSNGFNSLMKWSEDIPSERLERVIRIANLFLLEEVVKPLICHYYYIMYSYKSYQVNLVIKRKWTSFERKIFCKMMQSNHLRFNMKCRTCKLGNYKAKIANPRGILRIVPKGSFNNSDYRPIVCLYKQTKYEKLRYKTIISKINKHIREKQIHPYLLYESWKEFVNKVKDRRLFGFKIDIKDAFGNIDIKKLCIIINQLPINVLKDEDKKLINSHIRLQFVVFNHTQKTVMKWQWTHGLLQGDRLSACLCNLYLTYLDYHYFRSFLSSHSFFHRAVDDYFFCSTDQHQVTNFLSKLSAVHVLNDTKTISNITGNDDEIPYCGYIFNLNNKETRTLYKFEDNEIRNKFRLWNPRTTPPENQCKMFLLQALRFSSSSYYFNKMLLNTHFNSEENVLLNYFESMLYLSYKFDCAFMAIRDQLEMFDIDCTCLTDVVNTTLLRFCNKVLKIIKANKGSHFQDNIDFKLLIRLGRKAFILVLKRRNEVYKEIIAELMKPGIRIDLKSLKINTSCFKKLPCSFTNIVLNRRFHYKY